MGVIKRVVFLCFFALFCLALVVLPNRLLFQGGESYTFFVGDTSISCKEVKVTNSPALTKLALANVCGESAYYSSLNVEEFLLLIGGKVVFKEELSDSTNYYCSAPLPYAITLYGKSINLHICVRQEGVIVASPIIFGGY